MSLYIIVATVCWFASFETSCAFQGGPVCYNCQDRDHPWECNTIRQCALTESCVVYGKVSTTSGRMTYSSGCVESDICPASGKRSSISDLVTSETQSLRQSKRREALLCFQCCKNNNYCNKYLCDSSKPDSSILHRASCLNCSNVQSPAECMTTTTCADNEICFTKRVQRLGQTHYELGCAALTNCFGSQLIGRKKFLDDTQTDTRAGCYRCCADGTGNCNRDLCFEKTEILPIPGANITTPVAATTEATLSTRVWQPQAITTVTSCADTQGFPCSDESTKVVVCKDVNLSAKYCPRTCNLCGTPDTTTERQHSKLTTMSQAKLSTRISSELSTALSNTLTTAVPHLLSTSLLASLSSNVTPDPVATATPTTAKTATCSDHPEFNCNTPDVLQLICSDMELANKFCQRTCNVCNLPSTPYMVDTTPRRSTVVPTSSTVSSSTMYIGTSNCTDDPNIECTSPDMIVLICMDKNLSRQFCPRSCGLCTPGTVTDPVVHTAQTVSPTTAVHISTGMSNCSDDPSVDCSSPDILGLLCMDKILSRQYCPRSCGLCSTSTDHAVHTTPKVYSSTPSHTNTVQTNCYDDPSYQCSSPDLRLIICADKDMSRLFCPVSCGICSPNTNNGIPATPTSTPVIHNSVIPITEENLNKGSSCDDKPGYNCALIKAFVCQDVNRVQLCAKTCNICQG